MKPGASDPTGALRQRWELPSKPRPVAIVGAGGIVNDAHLPAYRALGLPIAGLFDLDRERAQACARRFGVARVFDSLEAIESAGDVVYDLALPPAELLPTLERLPRGAAVLVQKPMGRDLAEASAIRACCRARGLRAAVNFQLRYAPALLALRAALERGWLGELNELELRVCCKMPWQLWPFLAGLPRMELALHSIHYLDLIRHLLGEPRGVWAQTVQHPDAPELASSRSSAILDFGPRVRCCLSVQHHHAHGPRHQASELRLEGSAGAAWLQLGVNLDYPHGRPDRLELARAGGEWQEVALVGAWFPDAFRGPMSHLQRWLAGEDSAPWTRVEDAWRTMRLVEACYASSASGATPLPRDVEPELALPEGRT